MQVKLALSESDDRIVTDLNEKELCAIGRVTVHWAYLEHLIFKECINLVEKAEIKTPADVTSHSQAKRISAWRDLVDRVVEDGNEKERLFRIIDDIRKLDRSRHRIMKFLFDWSAVGSAGSTGGIGLEFLEIFDLEKLLVLADKIARINFELRYPGGRAQARKM